MLGDRAYDAEHIRRALRTRHILPLLAMRNTKNGSGLGVWRWVVERTFTTGTGAKRKYALQNVWLRGVQIPVTGKDYQPDQEGPNAIFRSGKAATNA
jgi:hypothetical protein